MNVESNNPGADATSTDVGRRSTVDAAARANAAPAASENVALRVVVATRVFPPARTLRITTRIANVLATNNSANGMATAAPVCAGADAASEIGIAAPENASDAATSLSHDLSRPRAVESASSSVGASGTSMDQRAGASTRNSAPAPAATPMTRVHPSHRTAWCDHSRFARVPRIPSRIAAGSCARKPATTAVAINNPPVDTPATSKAVRIGNAICPYAPCSFGNKDTSIGSVRCPAVRNLPAPERVWISASVRV